MEENLLNILIININESTINEIVNSCYFKLYNYTFFSHSLRSNLFSNTDVSVIYEEDYLDNDKFIGLNFQWQNEFSILYQDFAYHSLRRYGNLQRTNYEFYKVLGFLINFTSFNEFDIVINYATFHGRFSDMLSYFCKKKSVPFYDRIPIGIGGFAYIDRNNESFVIKDEHTRQDDFFLYKKPMQFKKKKLNLVFLQILNNYYKYLKFKDMTFYTRYKNIMSNYSLYKKLISYYNSVSLDYKTNCKFIYFSLNFEPEATLAGKVNFQSQLYWISLISAIIPPDYRILVKEHPDFFNLLNTGLFYQVENLNLFRNFYFYQKLLTFKNVDIINRNIKSEVLLRDSVVTVCMTGTIIFEASKLNRKIVVLENRFSLGKLLNGSVIFDNQNEFNEFFSNLNNFEQKIHDNNLENILTNYVFSYCEDKTEEFGNVLKSIKVTT